MKTSRAVILAACAALAAARPAAAQQTPGAELTQILVSRQALQDLATRLEQSAESRSVSGAQRARNRAQAAQVRRRLTEGDFQVGDRMVLRVEGETALTDTFTVEVGQTVQFPQIGSLSLAGVLRIELTDHVRPFIAQFVREPRVQAAALIRMSVFGGVGKQGYYTIGVDALVSDVLELAQGFSASAIIDKMVIKRDGEVLYDGDAVQRAIAEGRTLDALSIRAGDVLEVPEKTTQNPFQRIQTINYVLTIPLTVYALLRLFKGN